MKSKITLILAMLLLFVLTGCNNTRQTEKKPDIISSSESNEQTAGTEPHWEDENREVETSSEQPRETKPGADGTTRDNETTTEILPQTTDNIVSEKTDNNKTSLPFQSSGMKPSETVKPPVQTEPAEQPKQPEQVPDESKEPEPEQSEEQTTLEVRQPEVKPDRPDFDINHWISFAKDYAVSIGLELSPTAVECWDNPMIAGVHSKYLERDITDRLNRYKNIEGFTDVWVWAEPDSNGAYMLYIGYA